MAFGCNTDYEGSCSEFQFSYILVVNLLPLMYVMDKTFRRDY